MDSVRVRRIVFVLEVVCSLAASLGIGLIVGAMSATAGIGAGLLALAAIGFVMTLAWERGHAQ